MKNTTKELISGCSVFYAFCILAALAFGSFRNDIIEADGFFDPASGLGISVQEDQKYDSITYGVGFINGFVLIIMSFVALSVIRISKDKVVNAQWKMFGYISLILILFVFLYNMVVDEIGMIQLLSIINIVVFSGITMLLLYGVYTILNTLWTSLLNE